MAKTEYLKSLYNSHVVDLNDAVTRLGEIFVCPICCRIFTKEGITNHELTDGHIWPKEMRKKSKMANDQSVLLCQICNSLAGSQGDAQMQLYEKIKDNNQFGELNTIHTVEITERPGDKPAKLRVNVNKNDDGSIKLTGKINKDYQLLGSSIEDRIRFEDLSRKSMEFKQPLYFSILPPNEFKPDLVKAGWITSAYLMAFYSLGYRYILNSEFNFIRKFIISSFCPQQGETLALPEREDFHIYTDATIYYPDPISRICIPFNSSSIARLEICFLQYEVSLPILLDPEYFKELSAYCIKQNPFQNLPKLKVGETHCLYLPISCTKTSVHSCAFDRLLRKPVIEG